MPSLSHLFYYYSSSRFSRQIGRAVSLKTPRKTVPHLQQRMADSDNAAFSSAVYLPTTFSTPSDIPIATNRIATEGEDDEEEKDVYLTDQSGVSKPSVKYIFSTPARPSVLGSIFSGVGGFFCFHVEEVFLSGLLLFFHLYF